MKFGSDDKIQDWHLLTKDEAGAYVDFLKDERVRHQREIKRSIRLIKFGWFRMVHHKARIRLEASAIRRHKKDILEIDCLIEMVSHWLKLNNKEGKK